MFISPNKGREEDPLFENFEILFEKVNGGLYITLETKFHTCTSINEDFEIFTPPQKRGGPFWKISKCNWRILMKISI